jgi:ABC-type arginine/histidine transport system permease subunit
MTNISGLELVMVGMALAVCLAVAVLTYRDALRNGMNAMAWAVVTFFFTVPGLVIYLVVRGFRQARPKMP